MFEIKRVESDEMSKSLVHPKSVALLEREDDLYEIFETTTTTA